MDASAAKQDGDHDVGLPKIDHDEPFVMIVKKISIYLTDVIKLPSTFEQLRTTAAGNHIRLLVDHLVDNVTNPAIVNALLTLKWHFSSLEPDDRGINESRSNACEIIAWRFLSRLSERDAIDYCLYELPPVKAPSVADAAAAARTQTPETDETSSLLPQFRSSDHPNSSSLRSVSRRQHLIRTMTDFGSRVYGESSTEDPDEEDPALFTGLSALEIAGVADAKKFLSQRLVQKIIYGMWTGEITFWESLSVHTKKKVQFYNKRTADPFSRLRVPKYVKAFEVLFFATFLALYYAVLVEQDRYRMTPLEILLYVWLFAFAYDELTDYIDAGLFYYADFWSSWDLAIIINGLAFLVTRVIGLVQGNDHTVDIAFDILSLEALFLVPRICSLLSLHPYFGTLIPCLKEMTKDFVKFMAVVVILYLGFLTTFTLLARHHFTVKQMSWILVKVFFGSSYLGFEIMNDISPILGPPLMLLFVCLTNILLVTSLISILSNSFSKVISHAREEYLYVYSVYVLEASTSNRLTHFYPPLNLIPLILIRPLRLFVPSERLRKIRIILLKATHIPIVGIIWIYETIHEHFHGTTTTFSAIGPNAVETTAKMKRASFLANRPPMPSPLLAHDGPASPFVAASKARLEKIEAANANATVDQKALEAKVDDLSAKIAELTALIMAQQDNGPE